MFHKKQYKISKKIICDIFHRNISEYKLSAETVLIFPGKIFFIRQEKTSPGKDDQNSPANRHCRSKYFFPHSLFPEQPPPQIQIDHGGKLKQRQTQTDRETLEYKIGGILHGTKTQRKKQQKKPVTPGCKQNREKISLMKDQTADQRKQRSGPAS